MTHIQSFEDRMRNAWNLEEILPPFDIGLVLRALNHFEQHGQPLLEYRLEHYSETLVAVMHRDHYTFEGEPSHDDPDEPLRGIGTWGDIARLKRLSPAEAVEQFRLRRFDDHDEDEDEAPPTDEELLELEPDHEALMEWAYSDVYQSPSDTACCALERHVGRVTPLPIGSVGVSEGGCPGGSAPAEIVLSPLPSLTFLQVWLDSKESGIRLVVGASRY